MSSAPAGFDTDHKVARCAETTPANARSTRTRSRDARQSGARRWPMLDPTQPERRRGGYVGSTSGMRIRAARDIRMATNIKRNIDVQNSDQIPERSLKAEVDCHDAEDGKFYLVGG